MRIKSTREDLQVALLNTLVRVSLIEIDLNTVLEPNYVINIQLTKMILINQCVKLYYWIHCHTSGALKSRMEKGKKKTTKM